MTRKEKEAPLACKCKEGRCVECRRCPRRSCKVNRCACPGGPTRLRVPKKRKLGEIVADGEGILRRDVSDMTSTVATTNNNESTTATTNDEHHNPPSTTANPFLEALGMDVTQPGVVVLPNNLQDKVLRYKPLEFPEDVVEALQLPQRQGLSRFQRRRIAKKGMESMQTAFEKQCCKRTVQTFQEGVQRLAELFLPEAPEYLLERLPHPRHQEIGMLKQIAAASPRKSIQARTGARASRFAITDTSRRCHDEIHQEKCLERLGCTAKGPSFDGTQSRYRL